MTKWTKGPWVISKHCSTLVLNEDGRSIATTGGYQSNTEITLHENEANAHLIAAAPDMYEALKEILSGYDVPNSACVSAHKALAKADGESDDK